MGRHYQANSAAADEVEIVEAPTVVTSEAVKRSVHPVSETRV